MTDSHSVRDDALVSMSGLRVVKAHGTGNDFVIVPDLEGVLDLTPEQVRALCDRHRGVGGDGVLRVVPTTLASEVADQASQASWFMDYRNADGSLAEMCGNGARVFARYLQVALLETTSQFSIATRRGPCAVELHGDGDVEINMGQATAPAVRVMPVVTVGDRGWNGSPVLTSNPHCVVFLEDGLAETENASQALATLDLTTKPNIEPSAVFPESANVEFVIRTGERHLMLRVHERGVGETMACGTGSCAAMWAAAVRDDAPVDVSYQVGSPGGTVTVRRDLNHDLHLRGPVALVASVVLGSGSTER
ncbi:MAG: diaminopimelate epimerase [Actinomycetes bacterium]